MGCKGKETYLGTDSDQGNHWTLLVFDSRVNEAIYGDSLGRNESVQALFIIRSIIESVWGTVPLQLCYCHSSEVHQSGNVCTDECANMYPFQECGKICGVVVVIMAAIAVYRYDYFKMIATKFNTSGNSFLR